jgi:hypothetical protein
MLIFAERKTGEKPSNQLQQQTQLTYDASPGMEPEITVVRGKRSNLYATCFPSDKY